MKKKGIASLLALALLTMSGCASSLLNTRSAASNGNSLSTKARGMGSWNEETIYFVLLDRFSNGDRSNDFNVDPKNPTAYHGGDLRGVIDKLDYLKDLGATTIWISPVVDNDDGELGNTGMWGYHGYWAKNFSKVDEHLGTMDELKELVAKAHQKGLKILIDIVCNHAGYSYLTVRRDHTGWFHQNGNIQNWDDPWQIENASIFGLPDFAQENPVVKDFLDDTFAWWLKQTGADGYRVDTVKHVPLWFWTQFNQVMHDQGAFQLGEVYNGDPNFLAKYQKEGGFDSVFDFAMYYTVRDVFANDGSMRKLGDRLSQDSVYRAPNLLSTILDNHDLPRFLTLAKGNESKLRLALAFLSTIRGIPCIYQGTEWGMAGGNDPDNRRDMAWNSNTGMFNYTRKLLNLRRDSNALRKGEQLEMWQDDKVYAFARRTNEEEAIVVLNNSNEEESRVIPLRAGSKIKDGTTLTDRLNGGTVTVQDGRISVTVPGKGARIFLP